MIILRTSGVFDETDLEIGNDLMGNSQYVLKSFSIGIERK